MTASTGLNPRALVKQFPACAGIGLIREQISLFTLVNLSIGLIRPARSLRGIN
jgi:hypothetical protein